MERLTYRTDNGEYTGMPNSIEIRTALEKLSKIEDFEEEIGVDFVTLVKMMKDDVYINDAGIVGEIGNIYKERVKSIEHWPVWGFSADGVEYAFNERGRTWALSKEEFYETLSKQKN